jgi:hypothetical protein
VLDYLNWGGWGISPEVWTVIMLLAGVALAFAMAFTRGDVAYCLVIIWAFAGIAVKHSGTPSVATAAWIAAGLVVLALVIGLFLNKRPGQRSADEPLATI